MGIADSISSADYNFWGDAGSNRFRKITISGKKPGDDGFGGHDQPPLAQQERKFDAERIVVNPEFALSFTDEQMLEQHTVQECLELYRNAYTPTPNSPVLHAGAPLGGGSKTLDIGAIQSSDSQPK